MSQSKLGYALSYAGIGWLVFPLYSIANGACDCGHKDCKSPGKHPRVSTGLRAATLDKTKINQWWKWWPKANIGVATGKKSGIWVLDVDAKDGGLETLEQLVDENGNFPHTPCAKTGGGGLHYVFAWPEDGREPKSRSKIYKGIDTRGSGGYIVVEPSIHLSGHEYGWHAESDPLDECKAVVAPEYLLSVACRKTLPKKTEKKSAAAATRSVIDRDIEKLKEALPYVDADDYSQWIQIGMALHSAECSDRMFNVWCDFSAKSDKFDIDACRKKWASFNSSGGINLATVFGVAKECGWSPVKKVPKAASKVKEPVADVGEPAAPFGDWQNHLILNKQGTPVPNPANIEFILENDPDWKGVLAYCLFSYRVLKRRNPPWGDTGSEEWTDTDTTHARIWFARLYFFTPKKSDVDDVIMSFSAKNSFHPVREYLKNLKWDGVERVDHWLGTYLGAGLDPGDSDCRECVDPYVHAAGRKWMIAAVARVMNPPIKADCVLILEGLQGAGKSTALRVLGGDWFSDTHFVIGEKDGYQQMQGVWICELAELESLNKAESTRAKQFFSSLEDRYRPAYARRTQAFARQCVFAGSTNQDEYLKDATGNRRYWPVRCTWIDLESMRRDRDQLWAEALHLYQDNAEWWPTSDELALFESEQDKRYSSDAWEDLIREFLRDPEVTHDARTTMADIMVKGLKMAVKDMRPPEQTRVGLIMARLRWKKVRKRLLQPNGKNELTYYYEMPEGWNNGTT